MAEEAAQAQLEMMREVVAELRRRPDPAPAPVVPAVFKPPKFTGIGNVEVFIQQFNDVAEANQWIPAAALLHLRGALEDEARDCGAAADIAGVLAALRARFGLTPREARAKLSRLRREFKTPLQEYSARVGSLIQVAYPDLDPEVRLEMGLEHFINSLSHPTLQQHLLAVRPNSLEGAVNAGNEFLQVRPSYAGIKQVDDLEEVEDRVEVVGPPQQDPFAALTAAMAQLAQGMETIKEMMTAKPKKRDSLTCWHCGEVGHVKGQCRKRKAEEGQKQGNRDGQQ